MTEITGTAQAHRGAIAVTVFPGGALSSITLSERALSLGPRALATSILDTVEEATALANQRTKHALRDALTGLGLDSDPALIERAEATTPDTWRL
jgi:DNA-binding protein YbaB